jgi:hypothetical protein
MSVLRFSTNTDKAYNPLDEMEDLLDASEYTYARDTENRLSFECESKHSKYSVILEWHTEFTAIRCSIIMCDTQKTDRVILDMAVENANQAAWHGFFIIDGVGNTVFKTLISVKDEDPVSAISMIEDKIDNGIEDMDRIFISMGISKSQNDSDGLFADDDWNIENLALMFSDVKGNA